ncbi:MAG: homocysteine S-methyltransferase family protein [Acutalibacteraceae bacterium]|nr:homocysteine S-methyltransferase family protein [Acutalibacteraceae bacterium]
MEFLKFIKDNIVIFDGGMGTLLQQRGLTAGQKPELWNITHKSDIVDIHKAYFNAGSNVITANTFGANILKFSEDELEEIIKNAMLNAKEARDSFCDKENKYIALDIGPTGKLLKPLGDLEFETAVEIFAKTVRLGSKYGADLVVIETMNDSYETKAALLAVKENSSLPVVVTNAYGSDGKLMTGATPSAMVALLEGMGADVIGANCSLGPDLLSGVIEEILTVSSVPVILQANAGLPRVENGQTVYDISPEEFAKLNRLLVEKGLRAVGGCCGTTPEYIKELKNECALLKPVEISNKNLTVVSSYTHAVTFGRKPILIGERINPTGKKRFKQALIENDIDYILNEGINQQEKGVQVLDVNVGLPDIDEENVLRNVVFELQSVTDLPLQIDTASPVAMEKALRLYNGKAMLNSVSGKKESMEAVFPLIKKYGGVVVALTLDENGIPETAEGRIKIAEKILNEAKRFGINKKDIVFDTLAMTISADNKAALTTIKALKEIKERMSCHTSLGVSNISFGLPVRDAVNSTFFALALENGLSAAIMNPYSVDMMRTYYTYNALKGMDENCSEFIAHADELVTTVGEQSAKNGDTENNSSLQNAIIKGLKEKALQLTKEKLESCEPLKIVNEEIIPALNKVGEGFENKTLYLPQLLMSAEAAKYAFEAVKSASANSNTEGGGKIIIATVQGDIHDIGKNIVKLLLSNYGFNVIDLGKDVPPEKILEQTLEHKPFIVGLSALMTTTVPAMEKTIKLLKEKASWCKTVVGGAVLNEEYAKKIGADKYASDAMEAVRYAQSFDE